MPGARTWRSVRVFPSRGPHGAPTKGVKIPLHVLIQASLRIVVLAREAQVVAHFRTTGRLPRRWLIVLRASNAIDSTHIPLAK